MPFGRQSVNLFQEAPLKKHCPAGNQKRGKIVIMAFMTLILLFAFYPVAVGLVVAIVFALFSILSRLRRTVTPPLPQRQPVAVATRPRDASDVVSTGVATGRAADGATKMTLDRWLDAPPIP